MYVHHSRSIFVRSDGFRLDLVMIEDVSGSLKESGCGTLFWV